MNSNMPPDKSHQTIAIPQDWLNRWAEAGLRIGHLNTLVQREIQGGSLEKARALSERANSAANSMFRELMTAGAEHSASDPEYPYIFWHRGLACEALGQKEEARKQFDLFGQGLLASNKVPGSHLVAAIREKFLQYDLGELYVF